LFCVYDLNHVHLQEKELYILANIVINIKKYIVWCNSVLNVGVKTIKLVGCSIFEYFNALVVKGIDRMTFYHVLHVLLECFMSSSNFSIASIFVGFTLPTIVGCGQKNLV
jgi:hypothetical protein